ncbi:MAG: hypothetical protein ACQESR_11310 [Planctomycetota bacterium]
MESCPTQAVRPLVGLAADKVIRDRYSHHEDHQAGQASRRTGSPLTS